MRNAFAEEVTQLARKDPRIILLSGDIGNRLFDSLRSQSPNQFINCGVAEANMMGVAAGMGLCGLLPIVYTIAPFTTTRCLEQIRVDVAYHEAPVTIVGTGSGLSYASLGATHHSLEDFAIFRAIPNLQILAPWDAPSLRVLLRQALESGKPTYMRIGKKGENEIVPQAMVPEIGRGLTLRNGKDVCLLAIGTIASEVILAADLLADQNIEAEVTLFHTLKPYSTSFFDELLSRHTTLITIEEHSQIGGFGESLLGHCAASSLTRSVVTLGTDDAFMSVVGSQNFARKYFGIDRLSIAQTALTALHNANRIRL